MATAVKKVETVMESRTIEVPVDRGTIILELSLDEAADLRALLGQHAILQPSSPLPVLKEIWESLVSVCSPINSRLYGQITVSFQGSK
jgi:hypothetical protein